MRYILAVIALSLTVGWAGAFAGRRLPLPSSTTAPAVARRRITGRTLLSALGPRQDTGSPSRSVLTAQRKGLILAAARSQPHTKTWDKPAPAPASPQSSSAGVLYGLASWYGPHFVGQTTADGEPFNPKAFTAANKRLPFGTKLKVIDLRNGRSVVVRINDRGPYVGKRILDLSEAAARKLGMIGAGVVHIKAIVLSRP